MTRIVIGVALAGLLLGLVPSESPGQSNFFQGKTIKFVVGYQFLSRNCFSGRRAAGEESRADRVIR